MRHVEALSGGGGGLENAYGKALSLSNVHVHLGDPSWSGAGARKAGAGGREGVRDTSIFYTAVSMTCQDLLPSRLVAWRILAGLGGSAVPQGAQSRPCCLK